MSIRHASGEHSHSFQMTEKPPTLCPSESTLKPARPPRYRRPTVIVAQVAALLSIVFLLVVFAGNTANSPSLTKGLYFLRIDVSHVIPLTIPNATLVNSIAQTLGLRGFYQVGLWNYCQGYKETGVTDCSTPQAMYSFDPVAIILSQLLDGATSTYPPTIHILSPTNSYSRPPLVDNECALDRQGRK